MRSRQPARTAALLWSGLLVLIAWSAPVSAHPWGGLVVDDQGNIYFTFTCPMQGDGHVACVYRIDRGTSTPQPVLVASSDPSDLVLARSPSRVIYAAERSGSRPYRTRLWRLSRDDDPTEVIPFAPEQRFAADPYAVADDGQVFFARDGAIIAYNNAELTDAIAGSLKSSGVVVGPRSTRLLVVRDDSRLVAVIDDTLMLIEIGKLADRISGPLREENPPGLPFEGANILFDLAVQDDRMIFAYYGNRQVIEIHANGGRHFLLQAEPPWSPHGVDVYDGKVYVLESTTPPPAWQVWRDNILVPRIRVVSEDGSSEVLYAYSQPEPR